MNNFSKIRIKIFSGIVLFVLFIWTSVLTISYVVYPDTFRNLLIQTGIDDAIRLSLRSSDLILTNNIVQMNNSLFFMNDHHDFIVYSFILDNNDKILAHTLDTDFPLDLLNINRVTSQQKYNVQSIEMNQEHIYDIAAPVLVGDKQIGTVHLGICNQIIAETIQKNIYIIVPIVVVSILLSLLIGYWYAKKIIFSIKQIDLAKENAEKSERQLQVKNQQLWESKQMLKLNEAELQQTNATKDKFFSIIAHDLRSPFNSILGFSQLLNENFDKMDINTQKRSISTINEVANKTFRLLEELLLWSRSQRGIIDFEPTTGTVCHFAEETLYLLKHQAKEKSITLRNEIPKDITINADKNMFITIIRNITSNAIKFTKKNGEIIINARNITNDKGIPVTEISILDNGVGISKENQSKLFNISDNFSTEGTEKESGTGLGLILCKEFVEKHNGNIWIESEEGKGSKFIFTMPV